MGRSVAPFVPATTSIVNKYSAGGVSTSNLTTDYFATKASGVLGAGAFYTALDLAGGGVLTFCAAYNNSAVPTHTIRLQIIVDGTTVFDATSDSIASSSAKRALIAIGDFSGNSPIWSEGYPVRFNSSLVVKIASSQAGTDYVGLAYEYQLTA